MSTMIHAEASPHRRQAAPAARAPAAQSGDRADRVPDRGRPVRHPGHPAVARPRLRRGAGRDGLRGQCQHDRHGGSRAGRGASSAARIDRRTRHRREPGAAGDPDHPAGVRARSRHLHRPAGRAGPLHVGGVHADAGLSRRALQRRRCRRRPRRLRHRQRRQQPVRPPAVGRRRRPSRPRRQLLRLRRAEPERSGAGLVLARPHAVDDDAGATPRPRRSRPGPSICATRRCAAASPSAS